ncbi:MAG TPA: hypothetical protein VLQ80_30090 [Candidatus Saccharimonadia bacterium]|nr:hypothetical protein [Candidatus Saccharimonadia bacterium]
MSQLSKVKYSRHQWKHKAKQRADRERYQRKQPARISAERDRTTQALQAAQARLQQLEAHLQRQVSLPKVEVVLVSLHLFLVARIGFRAVSRVLSLLAWALGIKKAPCPQTVINWVTRLAMVRTQSARLLEGLPLRQAPFSNGLIWLIDISIGLGTGKILAVLAVDAHHHQLVPSALSLDRVHCIGVSVADAWTGDTIADLLDRLIAQMGRPAAYLKDGGSDLHKAVATLDAQGLGSPCIDDISHAVAGMLKRTYQAHPALATFLTACGQVSGKLKHTILACLAPPKVRTKARFMNVHRLFTWADQVLTLSPAGGAKQGSALAKLRACLDQLPVCKALIKRFRTDAHGLLECQKILKMQGLSHDTRAQCEPLIATMSSGALRQEFRAYLDFELETATTLGLDHVGLPISSDAIESLFGVAKRHGAGETQDANRIALRLPAFCGVPTREEAEQVLRVRVARQQELTAQCTSLSKQRREVLGHPEHLESLSLAQVTPHVELMPSPKNRSNYQEIIYISNSYEECHGPPLPSPGRLHFLENAEPPGRRETALTS